MIDTQKVNSLDLLSSQGPSALYRLAWDHYRSKNYDESDELLELILSNDPEDTFLKADALSLRGTNSAMRDQLDQAAKFFSQVTEIPLDRNSGQHLQLKVLDAFSDLAYVTLQSGDLEETKRCCESGIQTADRCNAGNLLSARVLVYCAGAAFDAGEDSIARKHLRRASLCADHQGILSHAAQLFEDLGFDRAAFCLLDWACQPDGVIGDSHPLEAVSYLVRAGAVLENLQDHGSDLQAIDYYRRAEERIATASQHDLIWRFDSDRRTECIVDVQLHIARWNIGQQELVEARRYVSSLQQLEKDLSPESSKKRDLTLLRIEWLLANGNIDDAIEQFERSSLPNVSTQQTAEAVLQIGKDLLSARRPERAMHVLKGFLFSDIDPPTPQSELFVRGIVMYACANLALEENAEAIKALEDGVSCVTQHFGGEPASRCHLYNVLAVVHRVTGNSVQAHECSKEAESVLSRRRDRDYSKEVEKLVSLAEQSLDMGVPVVTDVLLSQARNLEKEIHGDASEVYLALSKKLGEFYVSSLQFELAYQSYREAKTTACRIGREKVLDLFTIELELAAASASLGEAAGVNDHLGAAAEIAMSQRESSRYLCDVYKVSIGIAIERQDYGLAEAVCRKALELNQDIEDSDIVDSEEALERSELKLLLGTSLLQQQRTKEAKSILEDVVLLNKRFGRRFPPTFTALAWSTVAPLRDSSEPLG